MKCYAKIAIEYLFPGPARIGAARTICLDRLGRDGLAAATAPPNDNFANAIVISGFWGTTNVDTTAATAEPVNRPMPASPAAHSVWYKLIPVQEGTVTIHTFGSAVDTRLAVYTVAGEHQRRGQQLALPCRRQR